MRDLEKYKELEKVLETTLEKIYSRLDENGQTSHLPEDTNLKIGIGEEMFTFGLNADLYSEISMLVKNMIKMEKE